MNYNEYQEKKVRGTFGFPIEYHYVDKSHPRFKMPLHWHLEYELLRVVKGRFFLTVNEQSFTVEEGDCVLSSEGALHGGRPSDDNCIYECVVFDFNSFLLSSPIGRESMADLQSGSVMLNSKFLAGSEEANIITHLFSSLKEQKKGYEFVTQGLIFQLAGIILQNHQYQAPDGKMQSSMKKVRQLKKALAYIYENYMYDITLADIAEKADMSPKYFCRIFSQYIGKTPVEYINFYRVEKAAEALLYTDSSVTQVALDCGFNDLSYFVKTFRKLKGITPKQFAKTYKR